MYFHITNLVFYVIETCGKSVQRQVCADESLTLTVILKVTFLELVPEKLILNNNFLM